MEGIRHQPSPDFSPEAQPSPEATPVVEAPVSEPQRPSVNHPEAAAPISPAPIASAGEVIKPVSEGTPIAAEAKPAVTNELLHQSDPDLVELQNLMGSIMETDR